ncbi:MAG: GNAT family N-acetyltransferase [Pseudorhodobacter sp.]|nr:GNAT family N-acetyltransferase [Frankiaceae bacterium]
MLEIRPVLLAEHAALGELTAVTYLAEGYGDDDYAATLRDVATRVAEADVLVALLDGRLVGGVSVASRGGPFAEQAAPGEAVIRMLVTAPAARGSGAGTALVQACLGLARSAGCSVVRLSTQPTMTAAHRIYERLGFLRTPERDWSPVPDVDLLTYELVLAPAAPTWCSHCGEPGVQHEQPLEPPRWCPRCRRRMVVQVHPTGWSARCSEHGTTTS